MKNARLILGEHKNIYYAQSAYEALNSADALAISTEWNEYSNPDFVQIKNTLKNSVIFDGRNMYHPTTVAQHDINYFSVGR